MGQKVHPTGIRVGLIKDWDSTWYSKNKKVFAENLKQDYLIREYILTKHKSSMISSVRIARKAERVIVSIITARSGVLIGRGGQALDQLRTALTTQFNLTHLQLEVLEVDKVDADAKLVADSIAAQLEKRVTYRRAMKQAILKAQKLNVKGIKIMVSGRLGGAEIARTEWTKDGCIPLHTFKANIDYGVSQAYTLFGIIGVKVWIYREDGVMGVLSVSNVKPKSAPHDAAAGNNRDQQQRGERGKGNNRPKKRSEVR
jgi:small subunit ribosomal protein S3